MAATKIKGAQVRIPAAAGAIPIDDGSAGMADSGAKVETTAEGGTLIKVAIFSADPAAPENGDIWALDSGGNTWLKIRVGGVTKAVQLT